MKLDYNDYELISLAQEHNEEATKIIYKKYTPLIEKKSKYYIRILKNNSLEIADLIQESYIILNNSINSYNEKEQTSFYTYFNNCLNNRMISILRSYQKEKNQILNNLIYLDNNLEEEELSLINIIESNKEEPEKILLEEEKYSILYNTIIDKLSPLEECVFILKIENFDYKEIADILDKDKKTIDNAIQRTKIKIKKIIDYNNM